MKLNRTSLSIWHKLLLVLAGLFIFIFLFYTYVLEPQRIRISELFAAEQDIRQKNAVIQEFARKNPDTEKYLDEVRKRVSLVNVMIPDQTDLSSFLIQLEQAATACGLQLNEVKHGQIIIKTGYQEIPVEIMLRGSFAQTLAFLQKLETMARFNTVSHISIQSRQGVLESKLNLVIYSHGVPARVQAQPAKR
ncbi:type 4a pilus biogenesis protein PilO [Sporomusa acidovorans]|uniref:Pilus assembly protein, PilO n=1 Tax=Sporomusa acidovorans (strain ATCC 49682 / DSM 3132 / Mol) TaxID=1123286 RepID=A0ABZ3J1K0_SPOA4|nr:type 4a pilus biogenesis protein PilO [Sporomusa acidovorans]OZC15030.1 pilus assembly protein, PilO [Sporomusa acidovorans DSM 3132]SDE84354.1 type IV pilus assembly protein PilO [Sporomusa acidovorans]